MLTDLAENKKQKLQMTDNVRIYFDNDTRLMLRVANGDAAAFDMLYRKYFPILISYVTSINGHDNSSEDIAQEVFVRIWGNRKIFRADSTVKTYLFGYARNILREERRRLTNVTDNQDWLFEGRLNYSSALSELKSKVYSTGFEEALKKAIYELAPKQRQAISLFYVVGMNLTEAAKRCNCSVKAFEGRLIRARRRLRRCLSGVSQLKNLSDDNYFYRFFHDPFII